MGPPHLYHEHMPKPTFLEREIAHLRKMAALNPDDFDVAPVRLLEDHGFVNEYGAVYFRRADSVITNEIEILMLRERGARLETV